MKTLSNLIEEIDPDKWVKLAGKYKSLAKFAVEMAEEIANAKQDYQKEAAIRSLAKIKKELGMK
jgi:cytochrome c551/c552